MGRRPKNSRRKILQVAIQLFARRGYKGTTMEAIARASGVKKASLYYYFPSKRALYREALRELYQELSQAYASYMAQSKGYLERAQEMVRYTVRLMGENPKLTHLALRALLDQDPAVLELLRREGKALVDGLKVFVELGMEGGHLKRYPVELVLLMVLGVCLAPHLSPELTRLLCGSPTLPPQKQESYIQTALAILIGGLAQAPREGKVIPLTTHTPKKA